MDMRMLFLGVDAFTIACLLVMLVFAVGIVWRVEKKLDISYKFFVAAATSLTIAELMTFYAIEPTAPVILASKILRLVGALLFLVSILLMRDIVRELDHEKEN